MNPSIPQSFLDAERERDPAYFAREYAAQFSDDITAAFSREAVEACVVAGRYELPFTQGFRYRAAADPAGGGPDEFALSICHAERGKTVQDVIRGWHSKRPTDVVQEAAALLKSYSIRSVKGDRYSGEWVRSAFRDQGIDYQVNDLTASELFAELLPAINQGSIELLDDRKQTAQLIALERKTGKSGKDSFGHPPGGHDDRVAALAGAAWQTGNRGLPRRRVWGSDTQRLPRFYRPHF